jgi:hypothetical protein
VEEPPDAGLPDEQEKGREVIMATSRWYQCPTCKKREWAGSLFHALRKLRDGSTPVLACHQAVPRLQLEFDFALGATGNCVDAIAAFLPTQSCSWPDEHNRTVTFYPFLVVMQNQEQRRSYWLPYFHVIDVGGGKSVIRYGQWAPFLGDDLFIDLLSQAKRAGYLSLS